jgi:hypothetical protein
VEEFGLLHSRLCSLTLETSTTEIVRETVDGAERSSDLMTTRSSPDQPSAIVASGRSWVRSAPRAPAPNEGAGPSTRFHALAVPPRVPRARATPAAGNARRHGTVLARVVAGIKGLRADVTVFRSSREWRVTRPELCGIN